MKVTLNSLATIFMILISFHLALSQSTNSISADAETSTASPSNDHLLYSDKDLYIEHIHPNPANDIAYLDYHILNKNSGAKIVMHNVLGGLVGEYDLDARQTRLIIPTHDLKPGVYFYTLYVNNENLVTKKVIIKR